LWGWSGYYIEDHKRIARHTVLNMAAVEDNKNMLVKNGVVSAAWIYQKN